MTYAVATHKRLNITLPQGTIDLIDTVSQKGERSRFIDLATRFYIREAGRTNLRKLLRAGARARADRDLVLAREWFPIEDEVWQKGKKK